MGLFVKKTVPAEMPYYTIGGQEEQTSLIIGLGNIGEKYKNTRHNIGFDCIDEIARQQDFPAWTNKQDLKCHLSKTVLGDKTVILAKPTTYMNESGQAVVAIQNYFKLSNKNTVVIHDDLDIPFGQIRTRVGGGSAGNNGVKSITKHCHEDFGRVRIGIKNDLLEKADASDFVLAKFSKEEKAHVKPLTKEVQSIVIEFIYRGELYPETRTFIV